MKHATAKILFVLAAIAVAPTAILAGYSEGGAFNTPGYGARAWGKGGAAVATVSDEGAVYWNPAMLGLLDGQTVGASYVNLVAGTTARQSQLAYARVLQPAPPDESMPLLARHAIGAIYTNVHLEIQGGESYDENSLRVAYAFSPDYFISFGAAGDLFFSSSDVSNFDAVGSSVDFALRLQMLDHLSTGLVVRNAFSRYSYDGGGDFTREREVALGAAADALDYVNVEADVVWKHGSVSRWILGLESEYFFDRFALRGGYAAIDAGESRNVPYLGAGFRVEGVGIDYNATFDQEEALEDTHRFSVRVTF